MVLSILKKAFSMHKTELSRRISGGVEMDQLVMPSGTEPRQILQTAVEQKVPAVMSYLSAGKWHVAKVLLTNLGANGLIAEITETKKPHPINIRPEQPVGISLKHGYGKFIFDTKIVGLEPSPETTGGGTMLLAIPDRVEIVQRRNYFRVEVPVSMKVNTVLWHRSHTAENDQSPTGRYWQGRLIDISAGGAQVVIETNQKPDFKTGQFVGLRFTPLPYETPLMFNAQVRNILPTVDNQSICLGLQIIGLEASPEGHQVLSRLVAVVEQYYKINQSNARSQDLQPTKHLSQSRRIGHD